MHKCSDLKLDLNYVFLQFYVMFGGEGTFVYVGNYLCARAHAVCALVFGSNL